MDERNVPLSSPDSNHAAAHAQLLRKVPVPASQVLTLKEGLPVAQAAVHYEGEPAPSWHADLACCAGTLTWHRAGRSMLCRVAHPPPALRLPQHSVFGLGLETSLGWGRPGATCRCLPLGGPAAPTARPLPPSRAPPRRPAAGAERLGAAPQRRGIPGD